MTNKIKPYSQFPYDPGLGDQSKQALDWMVSALNQLLGQGPPPAGQGLQSLSENTVDPTGNTITSGGSRTSSITTPIIAVAGTTNVKFFWDGSNGSVPFQIYRDDNTVTSPYVTGSPLNCTSLTANTGYFFYPYWDEVLAGIFFATVQGVAVGTPPIAFTAKNLLAAQQTILRNRIPCGLLFATTGLTTPNAGTTTTSGGTGGGGGAAGGGGRYAL